MPPLQDLLRLIRLIILTMSVQEPTTTLAEQLKEQEYNATLQHKISQVVQDTTQQDRDKHSSLQTIFTISNGMVGSAAIVLPVLYYSYGVVNGLIVSFVICILSCNTTLLILDHNLPKEMDFPDTVQRVLGSSFKTLFNLVSVGFCFACGLINIILITQLIYPLVQALAENRQWDTAPQDEFTLSKISYQYTGILYILLIFPFFLLDRIGPLLKLLSYGAVSICTSVLFIMIKGFISLNSDQELVAENLKYTSPNLVTLAGVFSLAFLGQSMIVPISKNNRVQVHNNRDTKIAYSWTFLVYSLIGIFGSIAITTQTQRPGTSGTTILDFYSTDDYMAITIQLLMFLQLSTAFPVLQWITRSRFFGLFGKQHHKRYHILFSIIFAVLCLGVQMLNTNLSMVISYSGAFVGFFMEYLIPLAIHLQCTYGVLRGMTKVENEDPLVQQPRCKHPGQNRVPIKVKLFSGLLVLFGAAIVIGQFVDLVTRV